MKKAIYLFLLFSVSLAIINNLNAAVGKNDSPGKVDDNEQKKKVVFVESIADQSLTPIAIESLEVQTVPDQVKLPVPFVSQAPLGNWQDVRQENGCEETSLIMVMHWVEGKTSIDPVSAEQEIVKIADFQLKNYGHFHDTSNEDTLKILKEYFNYHNAQLVVPITIEDIKQELASGHPVIISIDGTKIGNPNYQLPGPPNHKVVVIGYDETAKQFIINDPGTSQGAAYRYSYDAVERSLIDYPTGYHGSSEGIPPSMIVIKKAAE